MNDINPKIENITRVQKTDSNRLKPKSPHHQNDEFSRILSEKTRLADENAKSPEKLSPLSEIEKGIKPSFSKSPLIKALLPEKIHPALALLETFSNYLGDNTKSLKDIYPVLTTLGQEVDRLEKELSTHPDTDDELKKIIHQLSVTFHTEQIKMQRGDYI